jgi:hypothetical protein
MYPNSFLIWSVILEKVTRPIVGEPSPMLTGNSADDISVASGNCVIVLFMFYLS